MKKKKRNVHKKNSCCSKIPLPKSPFFNMYLQSLMVNKTLNLVYLTLISTYPSCKAKMQRPNLKSFTVIILKLTVHDISDTN